MIFKKRHIDHFLHEKIKREKYLKNGTFLKILISGKISFAVDHKNSPLGG
jgi:hypothetical protein